MDMFYWDISERDWLYIVYGIGVAKGNPSAEATNGTGKRPAPKSNGLITILPWKIAIQNGISSITQTQPDHAWPIFNDPPIEEHLCTPEK